MIEFNNVSKIYNNNVKALSDVSVKIDSGDFVFLVGPSGSGKSTFIKMLLKEIEPTMGNITVADKKLSEIKRNQIPYYRRKIGMVFQDFRLIPTLNVYENVAFAMRVVEASQKEIRKRVPMVLSLVGLSHKYKMFPNELSGGEQQRVSLARAIVNNPSVLIADEPTGNLDPDTAKEIMELLEDINRSGTTIVMATHAKDIVDSMKKRVIAIEKGSIERGCTKMKINTINYFIVDALKSIKRNITVSFAAMLTVLVTFFVLGTFTLVGLNFNKTIEDVADKIEIKVYLQDDIKLVNQREVEIKLAEQEGVKAVTYESKDEAFTKLKKDLEGNSGMLEGYSLENNPLASSYIVTLEDASYAGDVSKAVEDMTGVESITNQQELIEKISNVVDFVQILGIVLFFVFIGVSIFLIMNTIKLAVYSRRREVGIMKFVGATDWFIRWPFVIEGMIIGAVGSLLATAILYFIYRGVFGFIASNLLIANLVPVSFVLTTLLGGFLLGGIVVGAIGSIAALRKFLVV